LVERVIVDLDLALTGGPATGLAFAPAFEAAGLRGAESIAVTAAMAGIVCGGVIGGPGDHRADAPLRHHRFAIPGRRPDAGRR
jgi:ESS family glutamate:Na+ symporter